MFTLPLQALAELQTAKAALLKAQELQELQELDAAKETASRAGGASGAPRLKRLHRKSEAAAPPAATARRRHLVESEDDEMDDDDLPGCSNKARGLPAAQVRLLDSDEESEEDGIAPSASGPGGPQPKRRRLQRQARPAASEDVSAIEIDDDDDKAAATAVKAEPADVDMEPALPGTSTHQVSGSDVKSDPADAGPVHQQPAATSGHPCSSTMPTAIGSTHGSPQPQSSESPSDGDGDDVACTLCGSGADAERMLLCNKCDAAYHTFCLSPPLEAVPEGDWFCTSCSAKASEAPAAATSGRGRAAASRDCIVISSSESSDDDVRRRPAVRRRPFASQALPRRPTGSDDDDEDDDAFEQAGPRRVSKRRQTATQNQSAMLRRMRRDLDSEEEDDSDDSRGPVAGSGGYDTLACSRCSSASKYSMISFLLDSKFMAALSSRMYAYLCQCIRHNAQPTSGAYMMVHLCYLIPHRRNKSVGIKVLVATRRLDEATEDVANADDALQQYRNQHGLAAGEDKFPNHGASGSARSSRKAPQDANQRSGM